jgi:hypothetical protein
VKKEKVIKASEHFEDDKALVLPAQMFRFGAETVAKKTTRLVILYNHFGLSINKMHQKPMLKKQDFSISSITKVKTITRLKS